MNELLARMAAAAGLEPATAEKALRIILSFIAREAPAPAVDRLLDALPGARDLLNETPQGGGSPGLLGGSLSAMTGMGVMGAFSELSAAGLSFSQVQTVTREVVAYAQEKAGEDTVGEIVGAIPGLEQVL